MDFRRVTVVGLGYIGLPTAVVLAASGADVAGVDVDADRVEAVNAGRVPFVEPDLAEALGPAVERGSLRAVGTPEPADAYVIAVPTPFTADRRPDLSCVDAAARAIAPLLRGGEVVVVESTVPPGATARVGALLTESRPDLSIDGSRGRPVVHVAYCPERVLPGRVMAELRSNDRVVGGLTPAAAERARDLYATFCSGEIACTGAATAELTKLAENSFRDVNIAFANELSVVAHALGVDVRELIDLANRHPRVDILSPGTGVGGHCIAVDPWFLVDAAPDATQLVRTAREVNDAKPGWVVARILEAVRGRRSPTIAVLGLAFKADIDDLRGSPAVEVVAELSDHLPEARIVVVEPHVETLPTALSSRPNVRLGALGEVAGAGLVAVLVAHSAFSPWSGTRDAVAGGQRVLRFVGPGRSGHRTHVDRSAGVGDRS